MIAAEKAPLKNSLIKVCIETYIDILLASCLNYHAIISAEDYTEFKGYFMYFDNIMNSFSTFVFLILGFGAPFLISFIIIANFEYLHTKNLLMKYGVYFEEYRCSLNIFVSMFTVPLMIRRVILIITLMALKNMPWLQADFLMVSSFVSLILLIELRPYKLK
jgi:hypothetical protein